MSGGRSVQTPGIKDNGVGCTKGSQIHSHFDKLFRKYLVNLNRSLDKCCKNLQAEPYIYFQVNHYKAVPTLTVKYLIYHHTYKNQSPRQYELLSNVVRLFRLSNSVHNLVGCY